jgi:hypothetical protein
MKEYEDLFQGTRRKQRKRKHGRRGERGRRERGGGRGGYTYKTDGCRKS